MKRGVRGVIWAQDRDSGNEQLLEIKRKYELLDIHPVQERISKSSYSFIFFDNGDTWRSVYAAESACGQRANISYIDRRVPEDIVNCVIKPCTLDIPYSAYHYYGPFLDKKE